MSKMIPLSIGEKIARWRKYHRADLVNQGGDPQLASARSAVFSHET